MDSITCPRPGSTDGMVPSAVGSVRIPDGRAGYRSKEMTMHRIGMKWRIGLMIAAFVGLSPTLGMAQPAQRCPFPGSAGPPVVPTVPPYTVPDPVLFNLNLDPSIERTDQFPFPVGMPPKLGCFLSLCSPCRKALCTFDNPSTEKALVAEATLWNPNPVSVTLTVTFSLPGTLKTWLFTLPPPSGVLFTVTTPQPKAGQWTWIAQRTTSTPLLCIDFSARKSLNASNVNLAPQCSPIGSTGCGFPEQIVTPTVSSVKFTLLEPD